MGGVETYKEDSKINDEARRGEISSNQRVSLRRQGLSQRGANGSMHRFEKGSSRSPIIRTYRTNESRQRDREKSLIHPFPSFPIPFHSNGGKTAGTGNTDTETAEVKVTYLRNPNALHLITAIPI